MTKKTKPRARNAKRISNGEKTHRPRTTQNVPPTPLTNSVLRNAPKQAKPWAGTLSWKSGFAVGIGTVLKFKEGLRIFLFKPDFQWAGQAWPCSVDLVRWAEDGETVLEIKERRLFKTQEQANAAMELWAAEIRSEFQKRCSSWTADHEPSTSLDERDLQEGRLKVMREQYPGTFKALEEMSSATEAERPAKMEAVFRAYAVDRVRLNKPSNLSNVTPCEVLPQDMNFILEVAKAFKAKSPYDSVDVEIAANWLAAGYHKMGLADYTRAINAKTGAALKPEAMEARRYKKLGLMTKKPPGPPPKT